MKFDESDFQKELINEFNNRGWKSFSFDSELIGNAFSEKQLSKFLTNKYPSIEKNELIEIFNVINNKLTLKWYENNEYGLLYFLNEGISTYKSKKELKPPYKLIDTKNKNNNIFNVAEEVWINRGSRNDVILLINGLPVFNFELKSFSRAVKSTSVASAIEQIKTYADDSPKFFTFNIASIALNQWSNSFVGSPSAKKEFWFSLLKDNDKNIKTFFDFFKFRNITNYLSFGVLFGNSNSQQQKYILRHHQIDAILRIIPAIQNRKGGYVWHAQGSGKTITISSLLSALTTNDLTSYTTVIDVDRKSLAKQIFKLLKSLNEKHFSSTEIKMFNSSKELRAELKSSKYRGIYITTTQKFNKCELLSKREDILFISDEAHRTHSEGKIDVENKTTYFENINTSLPNAIKLGFTGTPIFAGYVKTFEMFGEMIHKYTMQDAEKDGIITSIKYTYIKTTLSFDKNKLKNIKNEDKTLEKRKVINNAPARIEAISNEIGEIFINKSVEFMNDYPFLVGKDSFKAMFVADSVRSAYLFYKELKLWFSKQGSLGKKISNQIGLVVSKRDKKRRDDAKIRNAINKINNIEISENFKLANSKYKIIIVKDMLLTGYDVPNLRLMFFDRYIHSHNLLQAIARVNRNFSNKLYGQVISFRNITEELEDALKTYKGTTKEDSTIDISENVEFEIIKKLNNLKSFKIDLSSINKEISLKINRLGNKYGENQEIKKILVLIRELFPLVYKWESKDVKRQATLAKLLLVSMNRESYERKIISISDDEFQNILDSIIVDEKIFKFVDGIDIKELLNEKVIDKFISMDLILQKVSKQINSSKFLAKSDKKTLIDKLIKIISDYNNEIISKDVLLQELNEINNTIDGDNTSYSKILSILLVSIKDQTEEIMDDKIKIKANKLLRDKFSNEWWLTSQSKRERKDSIYHFLLNSTKVNIPIARKITDTFLERVLIERISYKENLNAI